MAEAPRSSFIPKQAKSAPSSRGQKKKRFNMLGLISTVILLGSLVFAAGTHFYRDYAQKELIEQQEALAAEEDRFSESDMASIQELDRKFAAVDYLLSQHIAPSKVFDALELKTKETVQFKEFSFSQLSGEGISLSVQGATEEFKSVALQALSFGEESLFSGLTLSDLSSTQAEEQANQGEDGGTEEEQGVSFSVRGTLPSSLLKYEGVPRDTTSTQEEFSETEDTSTDPDTATSTATSTAASEDDVTADNENNQ